MTPGDGGQVVEHVDALGEDPFHGDSGRLPHLALFLVDELCDVGRVDLNVLTAESCQLENLVLEQFHAVGEHVERIVVSRRGVGGRPEQHQQQRARDRDLDLATCLARE